MKHLASLYLAHKGAISYLAYKRIYQMYCLLEKLLTTQPLMACRHLRSRNASDVHCWLEGKTCQDNHKCCLVLVTMVCGQVGG